MFYTSSNFGFNPINVNIEIDIKNGLPSIDVVGVADSIVMGLREKIKVAISNSNFELPNERILICASPCDLKKDSDSIELAIAMAILKPTFAENIGCLGSLDLNGNLILHINGLIDFVTKEENKKFILPKKAKDILLENCTNLDGKEFIFADSLQESVQKLETNDFEKLTIPNDEDFEEIENIKFPKVSDEVKKSFENLKNGDFMRALSIAIGGKFNVLSVGAPGCGKTMAMQISSCLFPLLENDDFQTVSRLYNLSGLTKENKRIPFRMPHQTASIEGMFGGGVNCRCGEVSLAHKGVLFLDESAEFRSSVIQMLRVPIESKSITLSRAGRTTIYPADFQLFMATNPCPCGNFGSERICLCSAKSVEGYWHKFSAPLLDRMQIKFVFQNNENNESQLKVKTIDEYRKDIAKARIGLKKRESLSDDEKFQMNEETEVIFATYTLTHNSSHREMLNIKKVARVIADINGNALITKADFDEAIKLVSPKGSIFNN